MLLDVRAQSKVGGTSSITTCSHPCHSKGGGVDGVESSIINLTAPESDVCRRQILTSTAIHRL